MLTCALTNAQQWSGSSTTSNLIYRYGNVSIGANYDNAKFNIKGTTNYSHFCHGTNEDVYLRPGTNSGRVYFDRGVVEVKSDTRLDFGTSNTSTGYLKIHNASCCYNTYLDFGGNMYFRPESGQGNSIAFQGDGTVTIGMWPKYDHSFISTNGHKLSVNGGILCEYLTVIQNVPTSDYVFENDYNLLSLNKVEKFIEENKHLPDVPSAEDFKENGYKIGDMDDLLLRKVEELTLYLIQQNKRIEALEAENNKLRNK